MDNGAFTTTLLIPAAGFGKRVGSPEAKELLVVQGETSPMIEWGLELAKEFALPATVITRKEKISLRRYLESQRDSTATKIHVHCIEASVDWPDSLLQAKALWANHNIVLLPDTRFAPRSILLKMQQALTEHAAVYACFPSPQDFEAWGYVRKESEFLNAPTLEIFEKPGHAPKEGFFPWGVFGFRRESGEELLLAHLESTKLRECRRLPMNTSLVPLDFFEDVARK